METTFNTHAYVDSVKRIGTKTVEVRASNRGASSRVSIFFDLDSTCRGIPRVNEELVLKITAMDNESEEY